ncbi:hypothetical protein [Ahrensia kielensis]|uniref:hypothetical protein n=1 Tax=Ahrensia kielensis TaxID=76980 RepID=UPI0003784811|nr:hypothetical protein [Ahrensia kielensis]
MKRLLPTMAAAAAMLAVAACSEDGDTQTGADTTNPTIEQESTGTIDNDTADDIQMKPAPDAEVAPVEPSTTLQ